MKLCHVTLLVKDLQTSINFYEEIIGLKLNSRFNAGPNMEIAFLGEGDTAIELIKDITAETQQVGTISFGFKTDSLDNMMEFLKQKDIVVSEIISPNPSLRFVYISDPDGLKIQIFEAK